MKEKLRYIEWIELILLYWENYSNIFLELIQYGLKSIKINWSIGTETNDKFTADQAYVLIK